MTNNSQKIYELRYEKVVCFPLLNEDQYEVSRWTNPALYRDNLSLINVLGFRGLAIFKTADKTGNSRINRSPIQKVRTKTGFSLFFWPLQPFVFNEFTKIVS